MNVYCGTNQLNSQLIGQGGNKTIGTRNECLRKGIGVGLHMPLDLSYNGPYQPIDQRRFYCGDGNLPVGYDSNGTLQQCFTTGVGVGRRTVAQRAPIGLPPGLPPIGLPPGLPPLGVPLDVVPIGPPSFSPLVYITTYFILNTIFVVAMVYSKPNFLLNEEKEINWNILGPYIALFAILSGIVMHRLSIH